MIKRVRALVSAACGGGALAAVLLAACASPDNARLTVGDRTPSFVEAGEPMSPATSASISGVSRESWEPVTVGADLDRTRTNWGGANERRSSNARHAGRFPSAEEALETAPTPCCPSGPTAWQRHPGAVTP